MIGVGLTAAFCLKWSEDCYGSDQGNSKNKEPANIAYTYITYTTSFTSADMAELQLP